MTSKARIEFVRLAHPGEAAIGGDVVTQLLGGGETITVNGGVVQSTPASAFPADRGLTGGVYARVTCVLGAVVVSEAGLNPSVDQATGVRIEDGEPSIDIPIATLQRLAFAEAAIADNVVTMQATIANGSALSPAIDLGLQRLHRIRLPAGWTAAGLTFQDSDDGVTFGDSYTDAAEYAVPSAVAAVGRSILVDQALFYGIRFLKVRSGTSAAPVNQAADRVINLVTVPR